MASREQAQLGRDYLWNTAASLASALSLVVMLTVVTRAAGIEAAGIFSLAIAVGQQFQTLGMYEVRTYHVTDVRERFSFGVYHAARIITVTLMQLGIIVYALFSGATALAVAQIIGVASLRFFDAYEDVYYSEFQRVGRLDIGGRASFLRTLSTTLVFCAVLIITGNLLGAVLTALLASTVVMVMVFIPPALRYFTVRPRWRWGQVRDVLVACLPLFLASFIAMYLANAPRFAIDRYLDSAAQGYFAIIYMPATAINLLALLVFRPLLTRMAHSWVEGDGGGFLAVVRRGLLTAFGAFVVVAVVTWLIGAPLLRLVFGKDVSPYMGELMVLVLGGALNAVSVILYYALTTIRRQGIVFIGYVLAAAAITAACFLLVPGLKLMGASLSYPIAMGTLCAVFAVGMRASLSGEPARAKTQ